MNDASRMSFDAFPQPEWNDESAVTLALERLRDANDEDSALEAYDQYLWAVGNNHAGTFYPVVLATLPELEKLLREGNFWSQRAVIEALIDLGGSFVPEERYEAHAGQPVQRTLIARIHAMRPLLEPLAEGNDIRSGSAAELLELIDDQSEPGSGFGPVH